MTTSTLKIRIYGDDCLRKKSSLVKEIGPGERLLIQSMITTMHQAKGVGLAAPQVGINQRLFVVDVGGGPITLINPEITKKDGADIQQEGCLSIPEVTVMVERPQQITVQYLDEQGQAMEMMCEDLLARVIQHENDHLDGTLIIDYADAEEKANFKEYLETLEAGQKSSE